jgi:hypothetical protein
LPSGLAQGHQNDNALQRAVERLQQLIGDEETRVVMA